MREKSAQATQLTRQGHPGADGLMARGRRRPSVPTLIGLLVIPCLLLAGLLATVPGEASRDKTKAGRIVPQRSIDLLVLRMTPATVRARFGTPQRIRHLSESETGKPITKWIYSKREIVATFRQVKGKRKTLAGISTSSRKQSTRSGAKIGITESALRGKVAGLDCGGADAERWCTIGSGRPFGTPQTVFVLRRDRLREVRILLTFS